MSEVGGKEKDRRERRRKIKFQKKKKNPTSTSTPQTLLLSSSLAFPLARKDPPSLSLIPCAYNPSEGGKKKRKERRQRFVPRIEKNLDLRLQTPLSFLSSSLHLSLSLFPTFSLARNAPPPTHTHTHTGTHTLRSLKHLETLFKATFFFCFNRLFTNEPHHHHHFPTPSFSFRSLSF